MRGDILIIKRHHTKAAKEIVKVVLHEVQASSSRYVITIAGESGSGKTEIAHELARLFKKDDIKSVTIHQDDYFRYPPKTNYLMRRRDISIVGPSEVKLDLLDRHIARFKHCSAGKLLKPLVDFNNDKIGKETLRCKTAEVLIIEGTYTTLLKNANKRVFLLPTYRDTLKTRLERKREKIDDYDRKILAIEHGIISKHAKLADILVGKNYSLADIWKVTSNIKRVCMLSIHGYVEAKPTLGKTDTGGQVTYVLELAKAIAKKGIKVDIYTRKFQKRRTIEPVSKNVRIIRIPCGGDKFIAKEKLFPYLDTFTRNMERFMKEQGLAYDVFHSHYWGAGYVAIKLTERLHCPFIHTHHSLGAWKKFQMGGDTKTMEKVFNFKKRIKYERIIFKKARGLVMTSPDMVRLSKKFYNYRSKNYTVIPAGVNTNLFRPLRSGEKEKKIDVPQNYIFWMGRFDTNKGLDYLLRAFAKVVTRAKDLFLVIGGGSKRPETREIKLKQDLREIVDAAQIKNRIFYTGHIKDNFVPSYYRKAKAFVLPSKFEPFGMTAAEAMACGSAVIVSERAGIRKYLKNKHNCLIVNPVNKKDLSWALLVLNKNVTFRSKIARNGLELARNEFCWKKIAEKMLSFYCKCSYNVCE